MKRSVKRALALMLALMLAIPGFVLAEDDAQVAILPEAEWALEDQGIPAVEIDPADGLSLDGLDGLEFAGETPAEDGTADVPGGEATPEAADGQEEAIELPDAPEADAPIELPDGEAADEAAGEAVEEDVLEERIETDLLGANAAGFEQTRTVNSVAVTVKAAAGAFPAGATLSVKKASKKVARRVDAAIEEARAEKQTVLASYTFNIRVLDAEGNALRPAEGFDVEVSFALSQVSNANAAANVYHIGRDGGKLNPEALDIVASTGSAVTALADELSLVNVTLVANDGETVSVKYVDANGNQQGPVTCTKLKPSDEEVNLGDGWYAVTENITYKKRMNITGKVNLILCDGVTLQASKGIFVQFQGSLTIWGQSTGDGKGVLKARGGDNDAAIGSIDERKAGAIVINGGFIDANGGKRGAAIGGGQRGGFSLIEINGGRVRAWNTDSYGAIESYASGIGFGWGNIPTGDIVINGGYIEAKGIAGGCGIDAYTITINGDPYVLSRGDGGGAGMSGNMITINGGRVYAKGSSYENKKLDGDKGGAGIGCGSYLNMKGSVTINGGYVEATSEAGGAGIGGSYRYDCGFDVNITGGTVVALGSTTGGAGIGGGSDNGDMDGNVTISGGNVKAIGNSGGAGIGGGHGGNANGKVTITGGKVTAMGNEGGAGIGGGKESWRGRGGAGADVSISGTADVKAISGESRSSAIGHGHDDENMGTVTLSDNLMVKAATVTDEEKKAGMTSEEKAEKSDPVPNNQRDGHCQYRWYAHIQPCTHPKASITSNSTQHLVKCDHCLTAAKWEDHKFDKDRKCTVCGYQNKLYTVSFDPGEGSGTMGAMQVVPGTGIPMPSCGFTPPEGHSFHAWDVNGKMYAPKITFTPTGDTTVKAVYTAELYDLWVGGTRVNGDNRGDILGDKTASFDPKTKTLTLDGALITDSAFNAGIYCTLDALTVVVKGQSTVAPHARYGIYAEGALTIRGNALTAKGNTIGIYVPNFKLTLEDADVSATGSNGSGIFAGDRSHAFIVKNSTVNATGVGAPGITARGGLDIEGKDTVLTASGVNAPAMRAEKGYTIGEGLAIAQPAGGRVDEDGVYILDAEGDRAHRAVIQKARTYPLWIGDVQVTEATAGDLLDGAASYDPDTKTLTFESDPGFGHKAYDYLIRAEGALTIVAPEDGLYLYGRNAKEGVHTGGNLTLKGDVSIIVRDIAIYSGGTIDAGGSITASTTNDKGNSANPLIYASGNITVEGSLSGRSQDNGVLCAKKILIKGDVNLSALRGTLMSANGNMEIRGDVNTVFNGMENQTATGLRAGDSLIMNKKASVWDIWTASKGTAIEAGKIKYPTGTHGITWPVGGEIGERDGKQTVLNGDKVARHVIIALKDTWTVTFEDGSGKTLYVQAVKKGKAARKPADPTRDDAVFLGWEYDSTPWDFEQAVAEDMTLVARWQAETKSVSVSWAYGEASDKERKLTVELPLKDKDNENEYMWLVRENDGFVQLDEGSGSSYTVPGDIGVGKHIFYGLAVQRDGKGNYVTGQLVSFQVTVTKGTPVVTVQKNSGLTYTGNPLRLVRLGATTGGTLQYAAVKKGEAAPKDKAYSTTMPTATDAGEYTVYYRVEGDGRYNDVAAKSVDVTVKARKLTIYVAGKQKTYGEADPALTFTQTGLCAGDRLVGALEREAGEDAGTYTISRGSLDLAEDCRGNYSLRVIPGILIVRKAVITITADDKFGPTPAKAKGLELTWKVSGDLTDAKKVQQELKVELALGDERDTLPVTYPIEVRFTPNDNYAVTAHDGTYTVSEDDLQVSVEGNDGEYDGTEHPFVVTIEGEHDGAVGVIFSLAPLNDIPEDVSERSAYFERHSGGTASMRDAGERLVYYYILTKSGRVIGGSKPLVITPKTVGLNWTNVRFTYDGKAHLPTAEADGLIEGDSCAVTVTGKQTQAGEYTATATRLSNGNYALPEDNTCPFVIAKAAPKVTAPKAKALEYTGKAQALVSAGKATGGTMQYSLDNEIWSTDVPTAKKAGTYTVYYRVVGDANHTDVAAKRLEVTISEKDEPVPTAKPTTKPTAKPTVKPTAKPTKTPKPTAKPTAKPTVKPTAKPTAKPTVKPTAKPTAKPTVKPTAKPTAKPTVKPTAKPTAMPIIRPTVRPTVKPTAKPTAKPTVKPTAKPTAMPTAKPTKAPKPTVTPKPTVKPTETPTPVPKPADPDFTLLARMTVTGNSKTALKIAWTKVADADGYDIFFAKCNNSFKLKKTVGASESRVVRFRGLDKRESYKGYVRAWKRVDGQKIYIGKASPQVHAVSGGYTNHACNTRSVKLNRTTLTLKSGRGSTLKAKLKGVKPGMKLLDHVPKVRWYSTDANVATVDDGGTVKAVGRGTCTVYAIANNGVRSKVKVTVK